MDFIDWFVPPTVLGDPRKTTRHKGIAKSLLAISLVTLISLVGYVYVRGTLVPAEYALFAACIVMPVVGAILIRATADITLGLVTANIGGILILSLWAFFTGGITSIILPLFLANIALLSTFGNPAILLLMGAILMAALLFLYLATILGWLPASFIPAAAVPALMLIVMLSTVGLVVLAGVVVTRERARAKAHLREAQQAAEQSSRAKSVFLMSVGRQFLTPVNAILGLAEVLGANEAKVLDRTQLAALGHVSNAGHYLLDLVNQVLEMSRIESGELKVNSAPMRVDAIIASCLPMIELEARKKGIAVVNDCRTGAGVAVWADSVLVKQVLLNLLSNAVKFNREGGMVTVSCRSEGAEYLRVSVADTGIGIAHDKQAELFEPFVRLGAERGSVHGAGLGLAISRRLTERMRGRIGCESTEGKGSIFWIELPLAAAPDAGPMIAPLV